MLLRNYIGQRLALYYAQPFESVVGEISRNGDINFASLLGEWHWRRIHREAYQSQKGQWMTPVELFRPHYSKAFARFIASEFLNTQTLNNNATICHDSFHIVELGGGRGTNASIILSKLREWYPDLYSKIRYTIVDASPSLHELQQQVMIDSGHDHVECLHADLLDVATGEFELLSHSSTPTCVLALELFDNLPHDKIVPRPSTSDWMQVEVRKQEKTEHLIEEMVPLSDELIKRTLHAVPYSLFNGATFIPTVACGVLEHILQQRPNISIAVADFDYLPPSQATNTPVNSSLSSIPAQNSPIITDMNDIDHACYLEANSQELLCDILFPTDFQRLASFCKYQRSNLDVKVSKQADFLSDVAKDDMELTKGWLTGYSPLLDDFGNCSVLRVSSGRTEQRSISGK